MALQINEDELGTILQEVDRELNGALEDARSRLNKADDEKSASASPPGEASASASSPSSDGPPADGASDAPPGADGSAPPASPSADAGAPPMADPSAAPPGADGAGAPGAGAPEDLESKLAALPEDQLRHLYMAAKQALFARMQSAGPAASPAGAPPVAPPPAASPSPSPAAPPPALKAEESASASASPAFKGEMKASPANGGGKTSAIKVGKSETPVSDLAKSEDVASLRAQLDEQKKMTEGLMKAVTMLGAPLRKAVTSVAHLPKPGDPGKDSKPLSKAEVTEKLKSLDLKKTTPKDREAINGFYDGRFGLEKIAHLLG